MNEMTQLRALRADTPPTDHLRLAAGRQALLQAARGARGRGGARRVLTGWRMAALGSAAAITAIALVGGQMQTNGGEPDFVAVGRPAYTSQLGSAAQVLNDAADVIAKHPAPVVQQDQWVYTKEASANATDQERPGLRENESWSRYANAALENGRAGDDHSPRESYRFLASLPRDLNEVKKRARAFYPSDGHENRAQHDFRVLKILAMSYPAPPEGLATVYRALATIPGVKAARATDALKRAAIAIYLPGSEQKGSLRDEFLIDPQTSVYIGSRWIAVKDNQDPDANPGDRWKKGDVIIEHSLKAVALVDEENERP